MASPEISGKPDLGSLRIHDGQRSQSKMGKRIFYASIPVLIFAGIVAAAYAFRSQKPVVEVATAAKPEAGGPLTALNASDGSVRWTDTSADLNAADAALGYFEAVATR